MKTNPYLKDKKYCVFDIETTGLYPARDSVISAGFCDPKTLETVQFFTESPLLEKNTLSAVIEKLSEYDAVITYNGRSFDIPFLRTRAKACGLARGLPLFWSIDLYLLLRRYWPAAGSLPSLRQKAVEQALGLESSRTDVIDGGECVSLYTRFVSLGDEAAKEAVMLHNADDVRQLARICESINFLPWHRIAFEDGFMVKTPGGKAVLGPVKFEKTKISLKAKAEPGALPASIFTERYILEYESVSGKIDLSIYPEESLGLHFVDLTRLKLDPSRFEDLEGFSEGFLVLARDGVPCHAECSRLSAAIISTLF